MLKKVIWGISPQNAQHIRGNYWKSATLVCKACQTKGVWGMPPRKILKINLISLKLNLRAFSALCFQTDIHHDILHLQHMITTQLTWLQLIYSIMLMIPQKKNFKNQFQFNLRALQLIATCTTATICHGHSTVQEGNLKFLIPCCHRDMAIPTETYADRKVTVRLGNLNLTWPPLIWIQRLMNIIPQSNC